jgi:hypothetical protein
MKKIVLLLSIFFALGLLTNSCLEQKIIIDGEELPDPSDPTDPTDPTTPQAKKVKVNASIETTQFDLQSFTNERIGLFVYKNANTLMGNRPIQLVNGYSEFEYTDEDSVGFVFGYYPYSSDSVDGTNYYTYTGYLDSIQNQDVSTNTDISNLPPGLANRMLMISTQSGDFSFKGETGNIEFRNLFSVFRFTITKDPALQDFNDQRIKSFQMYPLLNADSLFTPAPLDLSGTYTVNINSASRNPNPAPFFLRDLSASAITGAILNSPAISSDESEAIVIWTVTAPFTVYSNKLVFRMETENTDGSIKYTTMNAFNLNNIERNRLYSYNVVLTKESVHTDDLVNDSLVDYPANTYIISEAETYAVSTKTPTGTVKTGDTVTWLWASKEGGDNAFDINDLIGNIEYDRQKNEIKFRVGSEREIFNKGNVILALRDATDEIVWSWHIWLTDKPQDVTFERGIFMDRNLGALTGDASPAVDTYGFVYQWGRKDPFYGGDGATADEGPSSNLIANRHTKANHSQWSIINSPGGVNDASKYPMQFIICDNRNLPNNGLEDWMAVSNNNLWEGASKTDYDPCPHGYRVPSKEDFDILHVAHARENEDDYYFKCMNYTYWRYRSRNMSVPNSWPTAGRRQGSLSSTDGIGGQLKFSGTDLKQGQLFYWTRTPMNVSGVSFPGASHRLYSTNTNVLYPDHEYGGRADAYSVRCIKVNE